ncbi:hypothetical protein FACS1894139_03420 [Planctomycetales bacterium]|nr:hypothetical protein FACS1894107_11260 [Planctomycetales bacterium]GHT00528.1 hypothetical protein FACS1894108_12810 [Planctomycetales bacterium]GHT03350.1 hypothetical protein FACS1894139_03420 [Planctomycetales bacterium]GHV19988.1 hypothetical protein AGMMS49959_06350 [Planctomycetales bacterium]
MRVERGDALVADDEQIHRRRVRAAARVSPAEQLPEKPARRAARRFIDKVEE